MSDIEASSNLSSQHQDFFVVGIGASAGGLKALEEFFEHMPTNSNAAFVVIQHLSPDFKSLMKELLARRTPMAIYRVKEGMRLQPNSIYLIPPGKNSPCVSRAPALTPAWLLIRESCPPWVVTLLSIVI